MRRLALFGLVLLLAGCTGFDDFLGNTFTYGVNPNAPVGDSENMRRARGIDAAVQPLAPEPGNIWPGQVAPMPTLQDYQQGAFRPPPGGQPFLPDHREPTPEGLPQPAPGSSTPPRNVQPGPTPPAQVRPPVVSTAPPERSPTGQTVQTQHGLGTVTSGSGGFQTLTTPRGSAVVVPNGNGTSTVIHSDGTIETIPTPR
ncbi:MAG: hypothetical protein FWD12_02265 [Alphaproteobacteria bacterium]|nr:hypothetical protein [Alphaproteobacteria bacterium]